MADTFLAVDLGAESGRVIAGNVERFEVVHRFDNTPVRIGDNLHWNILGLYEQIKAGIRIGLEHDPVSVGVDTWGVDYGLLDRSGALLGVPYHYRDARTDRAAEEVDGLIARRALYEETGIQTMPFNTLYQIYAQRRRQGALLDGARRFLTLPDLLHYWLSGVAVNESTNASTTQLRNPRTATWSRRVLDLVGLSPSLFSDPVMPGTEIGGLQPGVAAELGAANLRVVLPPCHDTAAAVVATPMAAPEESVYISSGTWSLLGIECAQPIIGDLSFAHNFTNEGGADGGTRFLKNIMGLWIVQECRRQWAAEGNAFDYGELGSMAEAAGPAQFAIEPDDERFYKPGLIDDGMADRITAWCRETDQPVPKTPGAVVRGVLESLARSYAAAVRHLTEITGARYRHIHVIGGGSQNRLLCQLTADASGCDVHAGPVEATALGNLLLQAVAAGQLSSIEAGRALIREHARLVRYRPKRS
ncbi:MAG: rhamnulokinase [Spirochaetaceae bacterium]|nr:rhamnulokinase [Spirochaetaceae bacterium]